MASPSDTNDGSISGSWTQKVGAVSQIGAAKAYPWDLALLAIVALFAAVGVEVLPGGSGLRILFAMAIGFVCPGYALTALLFPASSPNRSPFGSGHEGLTRLALAFGASLAVLPLLLLVVGSFAQLTLTTTLGSLVLFTLAVIPFAAVRRLRLPEEDRYRLRAQDTLHRSARRLGGNYGRASRVTVVVLAVAILLAGSSLTMAIAHPPSENDFTEFYLATEDGDGELQTADYPDRLVAGESTSLVTAVTNEESTTESYTVVAQLQRVDSGGAVVESERLDTASNTVEDGDTWTYRHELTPSMTGEDLRLSYTLYRNGAPEQPTSENAYRHLHLWVTVEEP